MPTETDPCIAFAVIEISAQVVWDEPIVFVRNVEPAIRPEDVSVGDKRWSLVARDDSDNSLVQIADPAQVFRNLVAISYCVIPNEIRLAQALDDLDIWIVSHEPFVAKVVYGGM
jgi:hypothetical protein